MLCSTKKKQIKEVVESICDEFNRDQGELIAILHKTQEHFGFLSKEVICAVAQKTGIPVSEIYGVVTFYSYFTMVPKGRHPVSICMGTACYVKGAEKVVREFETNLGIKNGQTTVDGSFSIDCLRCIGACGLAPVVMVGEKVYGNVKPEQVREIINEYREEND